MIYTNQTTYPRKRRLCLTIALFFMALNAFGGGWYGMTGAKSVPREWLEGTPFHSYFLPSLFLFLVIGGACLIATLLLCLRHAWAKRATLGTGALLLTWVGIQISMIGFVSWLQPAVALIAAGIMALAWNANLSPK